MVIAPVTLTHRQQIKVLLRPELLAQTFNI